MRGQRAKTIRINEKMHAFVRFSRFTGTLFQAKYCSAMLVVPGFGLGNYGGNSKGANDSLASGMDIAINPTLLTDFRLGYYRYNVIDTKYDQGVEFANTLGIPGINTGRQLHLRRAGFPSINQPTADGICRFRRRPEHQSLQLPADRKGRPVPDRQQLDRDQGQPHL